MISFMDIPLIPRLREMANFNVATSEEIEATISEVRDTQERLSVLRAALRIAAYSRHGSWCNQVEWPGGVASVHDCKSEALGQITDWVADGSLQYHGLQERQTL